MGSLSCGIRAKSDTFDNIFIGNWRVTRVDCFRNGVELESYSLNQNVNSFVQFNFENKTFLLTASDPGGCALNMTSQYSTNFSSQTSGRVSYFNLQNTSTCEIEMDEDAGIAINQNISFALLEVLSNNLEFSFSSNSLTVGFPTLFDGSPSGGFCENSCSCFLTMTKV